MLLLIYLLVVCNSDFCANGGTCEVSLVGLTCRWVEMFCMYMHVHICVHMHVGVCTRHSYMNMCMHAWACV